MEMEFFDSFEEMQAAMARNEEAADRNVTEWQRLIKPGDYVVRHDPHMDVWIYTEVLDPIESEMAHIDLSDPDDQAHLADLKATWSNPNSWKRNRRFGRHFSEMCPDGELGELHIVTVTAIVPKMVFELATKGDEDEGPTWDFKRLARPFQSSIVAASHGFKGERDLTAI